MRTSRISRQTARVVNALLPSSSGVRRSSRQSNGTTNGFRAAYPQTNESENRSTSPSSEAEDSKSIQSNHLGKRKRAKSETTATSIPPPKTEPNTARQSPRKAPNADTASQTRKLKRQPAKHIKDQDGTIKVEPPARWEEVYNITAEMRKRVLAPVDTMGCESLAEENRSPLDRRLQTLVALMLSSQTKDTVTSVAMKNLQQNLPGGFNLDALLNVEAEELNRLIEKVGFHNNKTKFIKSVAIILRDKFNSDIPDTIEGLVSLPGVGPKMAYLCMSAAWGRDEGIGVDVHVHRITNLWGWHKTSNPEQTRAELEAWLPRDKWHDINHLLVGFGQTICLPVGRKCGDCDLAAQKLCPSAVPSSPTKKKVKKEVEAKIEDGQMIKAEKTVVEADDVGVAVSIKAEDVGEVDFTERVNSVPDIEGLGAGTARKLARVVAEDNKL